MGNSVSQNDLGKDFKFKKLKIDTPMVRKSLTALDKVEKDRGRFGGSLSVLLYS